MANQSQTSLLFAQKRSYAIADAVGVAGLVLGGPAIVWAGATVLTNTALALLQRLRERDDGDPVAVSGAGVQLPAHYERDTLVVAPPALSTRRASRKQRGLWLPARASYTLDGSISAAPGKSLELSSSLRSYRSALVRRGAQNRWSPSAKPDVRWALRNPTPVKIGQPVVMCLQSKRVRGPDGRFYVKARVGDDFSLALPRSDYSVFALGVTPDRSKWTVGDPFIGLGARASFAGGTNLAVHRRAELVDVKRATSLCTSKGKCPTCGRPAFVACRHCGWVAGSTTPWRFVGTKTTSGAKVCDYCYVMYDDVVSDWRTTKKGNLRCRDCDVKNDFHDCRTCGHDRFRRTGKGNYRCRKCDTKVDP